MTFLPVTQMSAICAVCDPTASTAEITRPRLYGRRKERSRANVRRYGTAFTPLNVATESYAPAGMESAPDGSPVALYARLPELGEGEIVASVLPAGASV